MRVSSGRAVGVMVLAAVVLVGAIGFVARLLLVSPARLRGQAEAAARAGDSPAALAAWRAYNATTSATADSYREEARACLSLGLADRAERSLRLALAARPDDPEPWRLLLEIFRVEDRTLDAQTLGWQAYDSVPLPERPSILKQLTLALLADLPDDVARSTLTRWTNADPDDLNAKVALIERISSQPRATDPDRDTRLAQLETIARAHPSHDAAREALIAALLDAGEPDHARALLDLWPENTLDARYWRLQGRYLLDHARQPEVAVAALQKALVVFPQDWRSWYRLARALHASTADAIQEQAAARNVARIRETLDPVTLAPRLSAAFTHLDQTAALLEIAALCERVGLTRLATAWRAQAESTAFSHSTSGRVSPALPP